MKTGYPIDFQADVELTITVNAIVTPGAPRGRMDPPDDDVTVQFTIVDGVILTYEQMHNLLGGGDLAKAFLEGVEQEAIERYYDTQDGRDA